MNARRGIVCGIAGAVFGVVAAGVGIAVEAAVVPFLAHLIDDR